MGVIQHILAVSCILATGTAAEAMHRNDEILLKFRPDTSQADAQKALDDKGCRETAEVPSLRLKRVKLPPGLTVEKALEHFRRHPRVESADPNMIVHAATVPVDKYYADGYQWGLNQIRASYAWGANVVGQYGSGSIVIAILDSGVDPTHPDLAPKLVTGANMLSSTVGPIDECGHGTLVAGIAAAAWGTAAPSSIAGVAKLAKIMPIKVLDANGEGTEFAVLQGVDWAVGHGAQVINMSIGSCNSQTDCGDPTQPGIDAMERAWQAGAILIASTGNEESAGPSYPAGYPYVVGVGATDNNDEVPKYSNYGSYVDVVAPGGDSNCNPAVSILGPLPITYACTDRFRPYASGYGTAYGTSASAPLVSGLAAVLLGANPGLRNSDVVELIESTADRLGSAMWDGHYGYGRVNMYRALTGDRNPTPKAVNGYAYPNPFSPPLNRYVNFVVTGAEGQDLKLEIRDVLGNLLWSKSVAANEVSPTTFFYNSPFQWDGRDEKKKDYVPNGVYFAVLTAGGSRKVMKLAVLH